MIATNNRAVMCYLPDELEAFVKGYCEANGLTATKGGRSEPRLGTGIVRIIKDFMERSYTASPESTRKSQAKVLDHASLLARVEAIEGRLGVLEAFDLLSMLERLEAWEGCSQGFAQRSDLAPLIGRLEGLERAIVNSPTSIDRRERKRSKYQDVCPSCQSEDTSRTGSYRTKQGKVVRVTCKACSQEFRVLPDGTTAIVKGGA